MASKMATLAQDGLQDGPRWPPSPPKMVQDGLQDGPRESKIPPSSPKKPPRRPKTAPEASKRPPRRPKRPPRVSPGGPEEAKIIDVPTVFDRFLHFLLFSLPTAFRSHILPVLGGFLLRTASLEGQRIAQIPAASGHLLTRGCPAGWWGSHAPLVGRPAVLLLGLLLLLLLLSLTATMAVASAGTAVAVTS